MTAEKPTPALPEAADALNSKLMAFMDQALTKKDPDDAMQLFLNLIAQELRAERCYIFEDNMHSKMLENTYEWYCEGQQPSEGHLRLAQLFYSPRWRSFLNRNRSILFNDIEGMRRWLSSDYRALKLQNIRSLIVCPIFLDNKLVGIFEADNPPAEIFSVFEPISVRVGSLFSSLIKLRHAYNDSRLHDDSLTKALFSISKIFISMHLVDLEKDTFQHIIKRQIVTNLADDRINNTFSTGIVKVMKQMVTGDWLNTILSFTEISTIGERLIGKNYISQEFFGNYAGWCRARFIRTDSSLEKKPHQVVFTIEIINEEKQKEARLTYLAENDQLTTLLNRDGGKKHLSELLERATPGMFAIFDVNRFKDINDTYGHEVGDKVLVSIAKVMSTTFRHGDILMRLGGDEFVIFMINMTDRDFVRKRMESFMKKINEIDIPELTGHMVSVSIGIVFTSPEENTFDALYRHADKLLYLSKNTPDHPPIFD